MTRPGPESRRVLWWAPMLVAGVIPLLAGEARALAIGVGIARPAVVSVGTEASAWQGAVSIVGEVVTEGTERPIVGGPVVLVANGRVVARALTDAVGRFRLQSPEAGPNEAGPYEVRAEIIGRPVVVVAVEANREVRLVVASRGMDLVALARSSDAAQCVAADVDGSAGELWSEARKALEVEAWGRTERVFSYDVFQYERELDAENRIEREHGRQLAEIVESPSRSRAPDLVRREGYAETTGRGDVLYAPDGDVLLSDAFRGTHCFRITKGDGTQVGLAFEPLSGRDAVDIEGVMWFDWRTAELRTLEFRYTGLGVSGARAPSGGLEFQLLPGGHWTVSRWWVRTPLPGHQTQGSREEGVEVVRVVHVDGTALPVVRRAALIGTVTDTPGGAPVSGAGVRLFGTGYEATTNEDGRFFMPGLPSGRFRLGLSAAGEASGTRPAAARDVWLAPNQATEITLPMRLPRGAEITPQEPPRMTTLDSVRTLLGEMGLRTTERLDSLITEGIATGDVGALVGRVTDASTGRPIAGVLIRLTNTNVSAITEADGRFAIPEVRAGQLALSAEMLGYAPRTESIVVSPGQLVEATFVMTTQPIALEPITVTIRSRWLDSNGFYERRIGGLAGHYFTRADIERRAPGQFTELLRDLPGVSMVSDEVGKLQVRFRRVTTMTGSFSDLSRGCEPGVYYDGVPMNLGFDRLHEIPVPFIDGVEVYVGAATPIQFKHPCGVILIWTRRPR